MKDQLLTTTKVATILGVTSRTIQMWADNGLIEVTKTLGGHRRITEREVKRLSKTLGIAVTEPEQPSDNTLSMLNTSDEQVAVKILIVDADMELLKLYQMQISSWETLQTELYLANDGYDSLIQIGAKKPDIIITDLNMPRMDGGHMIDVIQKNPNLGHCQIVVATDLGKEEIEKNYTLPESVILEEKPVSFARIQRLASTCKTSK